eukprot:scaffold14798_cov119-Isochrysis_galbana.AAC.2
MQQPVVDTRSSGQGQRGESACIDPAPELELVRITPAEGDEDGLLTMSKDRMESDSDLRLVGTKSALLRRLMSLNILLLVGNCAALTAWFIVVHVAGSANVQPASGSPVPSAVASAPASPVLPAVPPKPPFDLRTGKPPIAPSVLLPNALTWPELLSRHPGGLISKGLTAKGKGLPTFGDPWIVQVPRPALVTPDFGRPAPLDGPRRFPTVEQWGWVPVSHAEIAYLEMKIVAETTALALTVLGDEMRETLSNKVPFLDPSSAISIAARAEDVLEGGNLWMFVNPPMHDDMGTERQHWFLAGKVLVCDDTADLAAYLGVQLDPLAVCAQRDCAVELAASERDGTPLPKMAVFVMANKRLAGQVDSISLGYHADVTLAPESLVWQLIAVSEGSFSRNACPFFGQRTRWGDSPDSLQQCDCKEPVFWC